MVKGKGVSTKRIVRLALFTALALIMSLIENSFPPLLSFAPGVKMGLSNVVSLIALIILGYADAYIVLLIRCFLMSIFGGNISTLMYALPAGVLALTLELVLYMLVFPKISILSISFAGAVVHNMTQVTIASLVVGVNLYAMLPVTLAASIIAGLFVGIVTWLVVKYLPKKVYLER